MVQIIWKFRVTVTISSFFLAEWCQCCYRTKSSHLDYASVMEKAFETSNGWPQKYTRAARCVIMSLRIDHRIFSIQMNRYVCMVCI